MLAKTARKNLLKIADEYARVKKVSRSHVSKEFYGRGNFLDDFKSGKQSISIDKLDFILKRLRAEWPDEAEWPIVPVIHMTRSM